MAVIAKVLRIFREMLLARSALECGPLVGSLLRLDLARAAAGSGLAVRESASQPW